MPPAQARPSALTATFSCRLAPSLGSHPKASFSHSASFFFFDCVLGAVVGTASDINCIWLAKCPLGVSQDIEYLNSHAGASSPESTLELACSSTGVCCWAGSLCKVLCMVLPLLLPWLTGWTTNIPHGSSPSCAPSWVKSNQVKLNAVYWNNTKWAADTKTQRVQQQKSRQHRKYKVEYKDKLKDLLETLLIHLIIQ